MRNVKINLYEVGDIFLTLNNINPATRFKGTWELIAKGKTLVGVDPNDSDFNVVNKTGGSKYISWTYPIGWTSDGRLSINQSIFSGATSSSNVWTRRTTAQEYATGMSGSITELKKSESKSIVQPYLTCYIWCRTA